MKDLFEKLFCLVQTVLPHHLLSRLVGYLARSEIPWIRRAFVEAFIRKYGVDMSISAIEDPRAFPNFNAFFTRALKPGMRPIADGDRDLACPADGIVSRLGRIRGSGILQAKNHQYSICELLGGDVALAAEFIDGEFATVYLSPKDYHRVHMPLSGSLRQMIYVPGRLFSVNQATTRQVPGLFARNERAVCIFDTEAGPMAVILVGAMIVAGIETVFAGEVTPLCRSIRRTRYDAGAASSVRLKKGDELGRFYLGSTVILLLPPDSVDWLPGLDCDAPVSVGQKMGLIRTGRPSAALAGS